MHVANLTENYINEDEPWYMNILCVRVTCKVHKSGNRAIIARKWSVTFLEKGANICERPFPWDFTSVNWKRWANTGPNSVARSFMTLGWSSSGPKALEGFKPLRSLVTPSLETTISSMKGADLSKNGTWVCSFLLSKSVYWLLNSSVFSWSDCATPFPFLLFRGGIHWVSFFLLLLYR